MNPHEAALTTLEGWTPPSNEQAALAAAEAASETASDAAAPTPGAWLNLFRQDMQSVLLAELEIRLQPVEGLLAALRSS